MYALLVMDDRSGILDVKVSDSIANLKSHIPEDAQYYETQPHDFLIVYANTGMFGHNYHIIEVTE